MPRTTWTLEDIQAFGVTVPGTKACAIVYHVGTTKALELLKRGEVDFPVLRRGRSYVVPTSAILELLGLADERRAAG